MPQERVGATSAGCLIAICGLPGSGKTTLARQLEADRGAVRLCPDEWMAALDIDLWDADARVRIEALQWGLAQDLLRVGTTVVIEWGVWNRSERDMVRDGARRLGARVELHYLDVSVDELAQRVAARQREDPPITRAHLEEWATLIDVPDQAELDLFDPPPTGNPTTFLR